MMANAILAQQIVDCCNEVTGQGNHALLTPFTVKRDVRPYPVQQQVGRVYTERL